jgi:hypothetical protein
MEYVNEYVEAATVFATEKANWAGEIAQAVWFSGEGLQIPEGFLPYSNAMIAIICTMLVLPVLWYKFRTTITEIVAEGYDRSVAVVGGVRWFKQAEVKKEEEKEETKKETAPKSPAKRGRSRTPTATKKAASPKSKTPKGSKKSTSMKKKGK